MGGGEEEGNGGSRGSRGSAGFQSVGFGNVERREEVAGSGMALPREGGLAQPPWKTV